MKKGIRISYLVNITNQMTIFCRFIVTVNLRILSNPFLDVRTLFGCFSLSPPDRHEVKRKGTTLVGTDPWAPWPKLVTYRHSRVYTCLWIDCTLQNKNNLGDWFKVTMSMTFRGKSLFMNVWIKIKICLPSYFSPCFFTL